MENVNFGSSRDPSCTSQLHMSLECVHRSYCDACGVMKCVRSQRFVFLPSLVTDTSAATQSEAGAHCLGHCSHCSHVQASQMSTHCNDGQYLRLLVRGPFCPDAMCMHTHSLLTPSLLAVLVAPTLTLSTAHNRTQGTSRRRCEQSEHATAPTCRRAIAMTSCAVWDTRSTRSAVSKRKKKRTCHH